MTSVLAEKTCTPCRGGVPPLTVEEAEAYRVQAPEWVLRDDATRIERTYRFRSFGDAFAFVRGAGELAEAEFHHPDQLRVGLCHGLATNQEDQRSARERFHHGGKARPVGRQ